MMSKRQKIGLWEKQELIRGEQEKKECWGGDTRSGLKEGGGGEKRRRKGREHTFLRTNKIKNKFIFNRKKE